MNLLFSADRNWAIGNRGDLLVRISDDMRYFKRLTTGNVVVMGRKTFDSLPGRKPLPGRTNIVLSTTLDPARDDIIVAGSPATLLKLLEGFDSARVFIIGGAGLFNLMLPYCDTAYITRIDHQFAADTFISDFDADRSWELAEEGPEHRQGDLSYRFTVYRRKSS